MLNSTDSPTEILLREFKNSGEPGWELYGDDLPDISILRAYCGSGEFESVKLIAKAKGTYLINMDLVKNDPFMSFRIWLKRKFS